MCFNKYIKSVLLTSQSFEKETMLQNKTDNTTLPYFDYHIQLTKLSIYHRAYLGQRRTTLEYKNRRRFESSHKLRGSVSETYAMGRKEQVGYFSPVNELDQG